VTLDEAKAALQRGRHLVLVLPPDVEQAAMVWELVSAPAVIVCGDHASAAEWAVAAPPGVRVHAVSGLSQATHILKQRAVPLVAGAVQDLAALLARSALQLDAISTVLVAWPEALVSGEHAAALDTLLAEAHQARRIVLSWNPAALGDFLERHARRALIVGTPPVDDQGNSAGPLGPARYAVVPRFGRHAAGRALLQVLDAQRPFIWDGGPLAATTQPPSPDAVLCTRLPTREQFVALARLGEPVLLITAAQLPYLRSLAGPLVAVPLPSAADRAHDRIEALAAEIDRLLAAGAVDAELALLSPLFERFDPSEVAAALLALRRQTSDVSGTAATSTPTWTRVFVNVGKKDRVAAKDLVGALIREVGLEKNQIGRIDVRDTFTLVDVAPTVADRVVRGLTGITIKGRRAQAGLDRQV
jgi:DbpA RNA binding domain